jgi:hypothetical protein
MDRISLGQFGRLTYYPQVLASLSLLAVALFINTPAFAGFDSDCQGLKLKGASGVPQEKVHKYSFLGTCNIIFVRSESGGSINLLTTVPAEAQGEWDAVKLQFSENFRVLANAHYGGVDEGNTHWNGGDITNGLVQTVFKCNDDPLITNASCLQTAHSNQSGFEQFSNPAFQNRPLLKGKTSLFEAAAMSKQQAAQPPGQPVQPPPPKPNSPNTTQVAEALKAVDAQKRAEAESLNAAGAAKNKGGANSNVMPAPGAGKLPPAGISGPTRTLQGVSPPQGHPSQTPPSGPDDGSSTTGSTSNQAKNGAEAIKALEAEKKANTEALQAAAQQLKNSGSSPNVMPTPGGPKLPPVGLPDLTSALQVRVAVKHLVSWGQAVTVSSSEARRVHDGFCDFAVEHELRNVGTASSGAFSRRWLNQQNPAPLIYSYPPVPAGGSVSRTDTLPLRSGINQLTLALDNLDQVKEGDKGNNLFHIAINVVGSCSTP